MRRRWLSRVQKGAQAHRAIATPGSGESDRGLRERVNARTRWDVTQGRWNGVDGRLRRNLAYRERPEPIPSFRGPVEDPPKSEERIGICCSGGGIRSAAFNLGALQALQSKGELERASYLAAVSGGSYIAAAFNMVAQTWKPGTPRPPHDPAHPYNGHDDSDPDLLRDTPPFAPGTPEEQYLRNRSSYLAPDGFGKLFLAYRVLLGLLFNVLFLATPLFAAMLILGWWPYRSAYPWLVGYHNLYSYHVPLGCWLAPAAIAALSLVLGGLVLLRHLKRDRRRRGLQVWSTRLLIAAVLVALFSIGLPELVALAHNVGHKMGQSGKLAITGGGGLAGLIAGVLAYVRETVLTPKRALDAIAQGNRALGSRVRLTVAYAAATLAGPALVIGVMAFGLSVSLGYHPVPKWWVMPVPLLIGLAMLGLFVLAYLWSDLTAWSLHPFYKRQLCTAFALKRVRAADAYEIAPGPALELRAGSSGRGEPASEHENTMSGRELLDTPVAMERDFDRLVSLSKTALDGDETDAEDDGDGSISLRRKWPSLIVCAAANVSDPGATPPGRLVTSFTFSAHSIGGPLIGAAPTRQFEKAFDRSTGKRRARDLSLPAAVAISGAAVAPSMGKMTRRPLIFLLALANMRLGVWVPNPRWVQGMAAPGDPRSKRELRLYGRPRPSYLIRELLGRNRVDAKYLFVTDGGHYENLGLVELLRRGCTEIYCLDASGDPKFGTLGDAVALARSELGVEIDINPSNLAPQDGQDTPAGSAAGGNGAAAGDGAAASDGAAAGNAACAGGAPAGSTAGAQGIAKDNVAHGKILYRGGREGVLIYARCVLTDGVPWDVMAHHREDPRFPSNSTVDQLYTDQKFESYRALGEFAGRNAIERMSHIRQQGAKLPLSASAPPPADAPTAPAA